MDDRWVHNKTNTAYISQRNLLSTNDECTVIRGEKVPSYVAPSALGLLQSNHVKFDTLCSSEKGMQLGFRFREVGMLDVSNSFSAWETLPEDEPPLCIAVRCPVSPHATLRRQVWYQFVDPGGMKGFVGTIRVGLIFRKKHRERKQLKKCGKYLSAAENFGEVSSKPLADDPQATKNRVAPPRPPQLDLALCVGQSLCRGSCCVIRKKFSASNFWKDCVKYQCTASQYIGEICRYLLAQPVVPEEAIHNMRLLYGNGLRAEIWQPFVDRFRVKIGEVYGSTEGTSNLVNIDGHVGACGFLPISPLTKKMHPVRLIRVDDKTGDVIRSPSGLCIACNPGESGAMVSTIRKDNPLLQFEGYLNQSETNKKIIRDVFSKGDSCFVSGDLLHWDRLGYVYFKDRTGDTFRWKGENVSTTEVEAILHPEKGVADATVYGVSVPEREGRAGMAAVVRNGDDKADDDEFVERIGARLAASLAPYALPQFIRLCQDVDRTGTFKLVKTNLQRLGYKLNVPENKVYIYNTKLRNYQRLNEEILEKLEQGSYPL
ncbi:hypothetical protein RB195_001029 [Necator americanus]|uniref:Long-chain-fatty-acid--CoA ligase n=1 Tax=Necator americanus TaxID=51031 RepID=A0ABR1DCE1_NECAM